MSIGKNILSVALAGALLSLLPLAAHAQLEGSGDPLSVSHHKKPKAAAAAAEEAQFPKATRADPKMVASDFNDKLAKIGDEVKDKKNDDALAGAQEILNNPKASSADRAMAAYYAGFAAMDKNGNDYSQTIAFFQRAISENALPNNVHYAIMLNVAQMQLNEQKYADALVTSERFLSETQSDDVKAYAVEGNSQYRLGHYPEAVAALKKVLGTSTDAVDNNNVVQMLIASYQEMKQPNEAVALAEQLAAKNPDDKNAQMIVASIYAGANQPEKASAIFDRLRSKGMLTESKDYQTGYRLLDQIGGRAKDIIALINEGLDKKILTPSPEVYSLLGQSYYDSQQTPQAIAAWEKGAALSQDGDISLNIAKVHNQEQQWAAAKTAAHQALDKGLEHPGEAWLEIGVAEAGLGNKAARAAAYREAAKDPETRAQANKALK